MDTASLFRIGSLAGGDVLFWLLTAATVLGFLAFVWSLNRRSRSRPKKGEDKLEQLLEEAGYAYDPQQDIFYSRMDAWQRKYGYCRLYDEAAAPLSMIIDCEPIHFTYGNKKWLIELWKGQYGMTTGCEIGVYTADGSDLNIPNVFDGTFYRSARDEDRLPMSLILRKNNKVLFRRSGLHWWLTGFALGEFSEPSELTMEAAITLKDQQMRRAFVKGLSELGYAPRELSVLNNTVRLTFSVPRSDQPYSRSGAISAINQRKNKFFCMEYQKFAKGSANVYETIKKIERKSPVLYRLIMNMGRPRGLFRAYEKLEKHIDKQNL